MRARNENTYWLYSWLESRKIASRSDAERELAKPGTVRDLVQIAERWTDEIKTDLSGNNLAAGTGLRLNDELSCPSSKCRKRQVDVLFRHAWHYFDNILIPDAVWELLTHEHHRWSKERVFETVLNQIDVALHIQEMGAADLVRFYRTDQAPDFSGKHMPAEIAGNIIGTCRDEAWTQIEATLSNPDLYRLDYKSDGSCEVVYYDPSQEFGIFINFDSDSTGDRNADWVRSSAAHDVLHVHIATLEKDLSTSKQLKASLGSVLWSHASALSAQSGGPDTSNVLFELTFPSLSHIPVNELLSLRAQEGAAFAACRAALKKAAKEMLAEKSTDDAKVIAQEIRMDIVEPELARLTTKLKSAQTAMRRKATFSIALTGVSTVCGLLLDGGTGAAAGAGIGLLSSGSITTASKFCDVVAEIESSDMFFLWKALGHAE